MNTKHGSHLVGIDYLRAVAVLAVIAFHLNPALLPGGFVGVDIFFVISGFVIARSLAKKVGSPIKEFMFGFYRRRMIRIAPALIVFVVILSIIDAMFIPSSWLSSNNSKTALAGIVGLSNVFLSRLTDGYFFARSPYNPFLHTWSLGVEEQFYLIFPLLFFAYIILQNLRKKYFSQLGALALLIIFAMSLGWSVWETSSNPTDAFYLLPSRLWELLFGALIFIWLSGNQNSLKRLNTSNIRILLGFGIALLVASFLFADEDYFPFFWTIPPTLGAATILIYIFFEKQSHKLIEPSSKISQVFRWIGLTSYSLYLWHWGVIVVFRWTIGLSSLEHQVLALLITFSLAAISYYMVERRILENQTLESFSDLRVLTIGISAFTLSLLAVFGLWISHHNTSLSQGDNTAIFESPSLEESFFSTNESSQIGVGRTIYLAGDSHAGHLDHAVGTIATRTSFNYQLIQGVGCPLLGLNALVTCESSKEALSSLMARLRENDIVIFSSLNTPRISDQWATFDSLEVLDNNSSSLAAENRTLALQSAVSSLQILKEMNVKVLFIAPTPMFSSPPFRCLDWFNSSNPVCTAGFSTPRELQDNLRQPVMKSFATLSHLGLATVWDPMETLCPGATCSAKKGSVFMFHDADHLSKAGNQLLLAPLYKEVISIAASK
jgi:peptidoglycan/LPS O-acetylase OafA/YrhL